MVGEIYPKTEFNQCLFRLQGYNSRKIIAIQLLSKETFFLFKQNITTITIKNG